MIGNHRGPRELDDHGVGAGGVAVGEAGGDDRRGVVDRGATPQAELVGAHTEQVPEHREQEYGDQVERKDGGDRIADLAGWGIDDA